MKVPEPRRLKSGNYFIQLRLDGQSIPITESSPTACKNQAQLIKAEYLAGKRKINKSDLTLKQAVEAYISRKETQGKSPETVRGYNVILRNRFPETMGKKVRDVKDWQAVYNLEAGRVKPKTLSNSWSLIRSACKAECDIALPDVDTVEFNRTEHAFLEPEQIKIFVAEAARNKYALPMLLMLSSCRASEARGLTWDKVDLKNNRFLIAGAVVMDKNNKRVRKDKNKTDGSRRYVPIFIPELRAALEAVPEEKRSGPLYTVCDLTIYRTINRICENNGLPPVGCHGLRHSFASLCYSLEVPVKVTMAIGGWSDMNTVMRIYTHLAQRDIWKYSDKLAQFFQMGETSGNGKGSSTSAAAGSDPGEAEETVKKLVNVS